MGKGAIAGRKNLFFMVCGAVVLTAVVFAFMRNTHHAAAANSINPHPRIFLTPTLISALQAKVVANSPSWVTFRHWLDYYYTTSTSTNYASWVTSLGPEYALAYAVLNGMPAQYQTPHSAAQYGAMAVTVGDATITAYPNRSLTYPPFEGNDYRNVASKLAMMYDWAYPLLSATEKQSWDNAMELSANWFMNLEAPYVEYSMGQDPGGNLNAGFYASTALIGYATYGDNSTDDTVNNTNAEITSFTNEFQNSIKPFFATGYGVGGVMPEGQEYSPEVYTYVGYYLLAAQSAQNLDLWSQIPNFSTDVANAVFEFMTPTEGANHLGESTPSYQFLQYGDEQFDTKYVLSDALRTGILEIGYHLQGVGNSTYTNYINWWLANIQPTFSLTSNNSGDAMWDFLFLNDTGTQTDYRSSIPTDYYSSGEGYISSRNNWSTAATWATFTSGELGINHEHEQAGNFTIYRNGQWLALPPPYYGPPGESGEAENVMTYSGTNDQGTWKGPVIYKFVSPATMAEYEVGNGDRYVYAQGNMSGAYRASAGVPLSRGDYLNPQTVFRDWVYLKPDYWVVLDRAMFRDPTNVRFQLEMPDVGTAPTYDGTKVTSVNGSQSIFLTPLTPGTQVSLADMSTIPQIMDQGTLDSLTSTVPLPSGPYYSPGWFSQGETQDFWRAAVQTTASSTSQIELNEMQTANAGATPAPAVNISGSGFMGAHIKDSNADQIVIFSSNPSGGAITLPISYTITPAATTRDNLIVDLPANEAVVVSAVTSGANVTYTVATTGSGQSYTTSPHGTLSFVDTGNMSTPPVVAPSSNAPVILYTDILSGPNSGGENNNGMYLTIFGKHFGATRGASTVTINGQAVAQYLIWSDTKIGVQVGPVSSGPIVVTVNGLTSNSDHAFIVRSGKIYYVGPGINNTTSTCAADLANGGTYSNPWLLTNFATTTETAYTTSMRTPYHYYSCISNGDTLVFLNGVSYPYYDGRQAHASLTPDKTTTSGSFVTFMTRPGAVAQLGGTGWITYSIRDYSSGYNVFSGLSLTGSGPNGGADFKPYDRIVDDDMTCPDCSGPAGSVGGGPDGLVIYGNAIHNVSTLLPSGSNKTYHAVYVDGNNIEIAWNKIYNTAAYNGIQINQDGSSGFYNQSYHDNDISDVNGSGINLSTINPSLGYIKVYNNVIHHVGLNVASDGSGGDSHSCLAVKGYGSATSTGVAEIYNNTMYDCSSYLNINPVDTSACAILVFNYQPNVTTDLRNNIVYQPTYAGTARDNVYLCGGGTLGPISGSNNIWYSDGTPGSVAPATNYGVIENPLYLSTTDYHLQSLSPAIGAGIAFGGLTTDFDSVSRPNPPSIGAYEYAAGTSGGSSPPPSDTTPPTTSITSPLASTTISGTVTVTATASDNVGVVKVEFYVDGALQSSDAAPPYTFSLNTATLANGPHTLFVRAYDVAGNIGTSQNTAVAVANAPQVLTASLSVSASAGVAPVSLSLTAAAGGTAQGTLNYIFYCNRSDIGTNITSPSSLTVTAVTSTLYLASNVCTYPAAGTYTAKVIVQRGTAAPAEAQQVITVTAPQSTSTVALQITSVTVSQVTDTTAVITVTTNAPASLVLRYGQTTAYGETIGSSPFLSTVFEDLTGLAENTTYDFEVIATPQGTSTPVTSQNYVFTTAVTPTPPASGGGGGGSSSGGGGGGSSYIPPAPASPFTVGVSLASTTGATAKITVTTSLPAGDPALLRHLHPIRPEHQPLPGISYHVIFQPRRPRSERHLPSEGRLPRGQ